MMTVMKPSHLWYVSYGSNMQRAKMMAYIAGGRPAGGLRIHEGCTDTTPPVRDMGVRVDGFRLHFALTSPFWDCGVAFVDEAPGESFWARAYLVTTRQFEQVVAQENALHPDDAEAIDLTQVLTTGKDVRGPGSYETLRLVGMFDGVPALTFTAPFGAEDALSQRGLIDIAGSGLQPIQVNAPSDAYCRTIGTGLAETFAMTPEDQADYIRSTQGGNLRGLELAAALGAVPSRVST